MDFGLGLWTLDFEFEFDFDFDMFCLCHFVFGYVILKHPQDGNGELDQKEFMTFLAAHVCRCLFALSVSCLGICMCVFLSLGFVFGPQRVYDVPSWLCVFCVGVCILCVLSLESLRVYDAPGYSCFVFVFVCRRLYVVRWLLGRCDVFLSLCQG